MQLMTTSIDKYIIKVFKGEREERERRKGGGGREEGTLTNCK